MSQQLSPCSRACVIQILKPSHNETMFCNKRSHCSEEPSHHNKKTAPYMHQLVKEKKVKTLISQLCPTLCNPTDYSPPGSSPWNSPGKNTGVDCCSLVQGIFPTQGSNPGVKPHYRQILYHLSHHGSPSIAKKTQCRQK